MTTDEAEELIVFSKARLDEDEEAACDLLRTAQDVSLSLQDPALLGRHIPGWYSWPEVEAMCTGRLADIPAERAILKLHQPDIGPHCTECSCAGALAATDCFDLVDWPCATVRQTIAGWSSHPEYRQGWKP